MKEIVERLHENRQVELAKSILEAKGYEVRLKEEVSSGVKTLATKDDISEDARDLIEEYFKETDPSKIYVWDQENPNIKQAIRLMDRGEIRRTDGVRVEDGFMEYYVYREKYMIYLIQHGKGSIYFNDEEILRGLPTSFPEDEKLIGTIYDKYPFEMKKIILDLYNKGQEVIASGKDEEDMREECIEELKKSSGGATSIYHELMLPILVAKERIKFIKGGTYGGQIKYKPDDPRYYFTTLRKEAGLTKGSWYNYY